MSKNIDWDKLSFSYMNTNSNIQYNYKNGEWGEGRLVAEPYINIHIAATSLHYGQAAFEGLKAFKSKDGKIRVFRPEENSKRLNNSAKRIFMPQVPEAMFLEAINKVVSANKDYIPPYGSGGSLYIRPLLIGTGARIGLNPADEYIFLILVVPVGAYYKGGLEGVKALVMDNFDRAATLGVGNIKVAGNYAAGLLPQMEAKKAGFPINLFLDAKEHTFIDEFGTSNFFGISHDGKYVTPKSSSVLPSITNKSLQDVARDLGLDVECRKINFEEIKDFKEIAACGTAVVITPIKEIVRGDKSYKVGPENAVGEVSESLYKQITSIQNGEVQDKHSWMFEIDEN